MCNYTRFISREEGGETSAKGGRLGTHQRWESDNRLTRQSWQERDLWGCLKLFGVLRLVIILLLLILGPDESTGD